jgi:hypothetical protein
VPAQAFGQPARKRAGRREPAEGVGDRVGRRLRALAPQPPRTAFRNRRARLGCP